MDRRHCLAVSVTGLLLLLSSAVQAGSWSPEYEKKVGAEAAAAAEKQYKVLPDDPRVKTLNEMAGILAKASTRPDVVYSVKVLDDKEVNAFSLPGGYVYVTKGLLDDAQSDHEVAGVIAHEIAHNCGYDGLERAKKSEKLFMGSLAGALVTLIVGGKSADVNAVLAAGEYIRLGAISQYSMDVEKRADQRAVTYMINSKVFNPVGLLTFMERLAARDRHTPQQELGVYADHPDSNIRSRLIVGYLQNDDVEINRRAVTKWEPPTSVEKEADGKKLATLSLWDVTLFQTAHPGGSATALERTNALAAGLKDALAAGMEAYEVTVETTGAHPEVRLRGKPWLTVYAEDVLTPGTTPEAVAQQVNENLAAALHKELLNRWF